MVRKAFSSEKITSVPNFLSITKYNFIENIFQAPGGKKVPVMSSTILYSLYSLYSRKNVGGGGTVRQAVGEVQSLEL